MDEPLGALDKQLRENLQLEMRRLHGDLGITIDLCDARPGRGADDVGPHRRHERRAVAGRTRRTISTTGRPAASSPPSSASRISCRRSYAASRTKSSSPSTARHHPRHRAQSPAAGKKVMLAARPERLRFVDGGVNAIAPQNRLSVTVTEAVFAGERCSVHAARGRRHRHRAEARPSSAAIRRRAVGEQVEISWSVADTILV